MTKENVMEKLERILEDTKIGVLSSISKGKPYSRYMTFYNKGITLYTPTHKDTYKVEDMVTNSHVHIILGYKEDGDAYFELQGIAVISTDPDLKAHLWNDSLSAYFDSPTDPNYIVLVIEPKKVTIMNDTDYDGPQIVEL